MHKALERQLGVTNVEMDTLAGWVSFAYPEQRKIDAAEISDVLNSAGYTLREISFEVSGEVAQEQSGLILIVAGTGQKIPVAEGSAARSQGRVSAIVIAGAEGMRIKISEVTN